jgi:hypothetical protein
MQQRSTKIQLSCNGIDFWIHDVVTTWTLESCGTLAVTKQKVSLHIASLHMSFTYSQYGLSSCRAKKATIAWMHSETGSLQEIWHALGQMFNHVLPFICMQNAWDVQAQHEEPYVFSQRRRVISRDSSSVLRAIEICHTSNLITTQVFFRKATHPRAPINAQKNLMTSDHQAQYDLHRWSHMATWCSMVCASQCI